MYINGISLQDVEFTECDTCRKKPGTPSLCNGCLKNRRSLDLLKTVIDYLSMEKELRGLRAQLVAYAEAQEQEQKHQSE